MLLQNGERSDMTEPPHGVVAPIVSTFPVGETNFKK